MRIEMRITNEAQIYELRRKLREMLDGNCTPEESAEIQTAVIELARNALNYTGSGDIAVEIADVLLTVVCEDNGPGILEWDIKKYDVLEQNKSLGFGLGIVSRLMDTMDIHTEAGKGTRVVATRRLGIRTGPPPKAEGNK